MNVLSKKIIVGEREVSSLYFLDASEWDIYSCWRYFQSNLWCTGPFFKATARTQFPRFMFQLSFCQWLNTFEAFEARLRVRFGCGMKQMLLLVPNACINETWFHFLLTKCFANETRMMTQSALDQRSCFERIIKIKHVCIEFHTIRLQFHI